MKNKITLILILTIFLFKITNAQWQNIGPSGGMVYDIVQNGSNQLCLTPGGLYFSSNNGTNWVPSRGGIPFVEIRTINVSGNKFVAGTGNGVYASVDGMNWTLQGNSQLKIIYSRGNYLFAVAYAIPSRVVFRSTDAGATWQSTPVNFDVGSGIASIDTVLFIGTQSGIAYSINNGQSWAGMNILVGGFSIGAVTDIKAVTGGLLIASSSGLYKHNGNVYSTAVQNASNGIPSVFLATKISSMTNRYRISITDKMNPTLFNAVMKSTDGINWSVDSSNYTVSKVFCFRNFGATSFMCSSAGIMKTTDYGVTWSKSETGIKAHIVKDIQQANGKVYAVIGNAVANSGYMYNYGGGIFSSADDGSTWQKLSLPDTLSISKLFIDGNKMIAFGSYTGTGNGNNGLLIRSTDTGSTWSNITGNTTPVYNDNIYYTNNILYLTSSTSFDKSTDLGATWQNMSVSGFPGTSFTAVEAIGSNLFATASLYLNYGGGVFKTSDNGATWAQSNNGFDNNMPVFKLKAIGNSLFAIQRNAVSGLGTALHRSDNLAGAWSNIGGTLPQHFYNDVYGWSGNIFVSTGYSISNSMMQPDGIDSGAVYQSLNNGTSWTNISSGLPGVTFTNMAVNNSKLYAGTTGYSVWSMAVTPNGNTGINTRETAKDHLSIFPDPANSEINISCNSTLEKVEIYNLSGMLQSVSSDKNKIDINGLSSGLYFIKVFSGNGISTQKFIKQ